MICHSDTIRLVDTPICISHVRRRFTYTLPGKYIMCFFLFSHEYNSIISDKTVKWSTILPENSVHSYFSYISLVLRQWLMLVFPYRHGHGLQKNEYIYIYMRYYTKKLTNLFNHVIFEIVKGSRNTPSSLLAHVFPDPIASVDCPMPSRPCVTQTYHH